MIRLFFHLLGSLCVLQRAASQCHSGQIACDSICATKCDGFVECADKSDETAQLCAGYNCNSNQSNSGTREFEEFVGHSIVKFQCDYGGCILGNFKCNGSPDCWDGSDETPELCSSKKCSRRYFQCDYGACIRKVWSCNGNRNCADMSDETEQLCKAKRCRPSQFKCRYGACIPQGERCDGSPNCIDNSDESEEECGHIIRPPPTSTAITPSPKPPPPPTTAVTSSTKPPAVTPLPISPTPPSQPEDPPIAFPETTTPTIDWCQEESLCACPDPNHHFCVACNNTESCSALGNGTVCSIKPAGGPYSQVKVEVLSCGVNHMISLAGFVRHNRVSQCGSSEGVPVESVVLVNCWGTNVLAQCHSDGTWHTYRSGVSKSSLSTTLCQFQEVNSPVCGQRPRFVRAPGRTAHLKVAPQWPWMVGLKQDGSYFCTANIISPHYLLTAAHCVIRTQENAEQVLNPHDVKIQRVSAEGGIMKDRISEIHIHPNFTAGLRPSNDVALLRMKKEILFSHQVYPACVHPELLPEQEIAATFNRTINEYKWELILQRRDSRCHSPHDLCGRSLGIASHQFCAMDIASDRYLPDGSSGGPYLVNVGSDVNERWAVAGLVTSYNQQSLCKLPLTIFTSLKDFWEWILNCVHNDICN